MWVVLLIMLIFKNNSIGKLTGIRLSLPNILYILHKMGYSVLILMVRDFRYGTGA